MKGARSVISIVVRLNPFSSKVSPILHIENCRFASINITKAAQNTQEISKFET